MSRLPYEKPHRLWSDDELRRGKEVWTDHVKDAGGWSSAYMAAKELDAICRAADARGLAGFENPYPIVVG